MYITKLNIFITNIKKKNALFSGTVRFALLKFSMDLGTVNTFQKIDHATENKKRCCTVRFVTIRFCMDTEKNSDIKYIRKSIKCLLGPFSADFQRKTKMTRL